MITYTQTVQMPLTQFKAIISQTINNLYPEADYNRMEIELDDQAQTVKINLLKDKGRDDPTSYGRSYP